MTDKEKLLKIKKLADEMYYAAQYLTTDASHLHKAMNEYHQFIIHDYHKEELVSEELEEAAKNVGQKYFPNEYNIWARPNYEAVKAECAFKDGVKWGKNQAKVEIQAQSMALAHGCPKEPVSEGLEEEIQKIIHNHFFDLDGIAIAGTSVYATVDDMVYIAKHFADWQKEKMLAKAIDIEVKIDAGGYPYIPQIELWDYDKDEPLAEEGNKVKVIVIKEE